MTSAIYIIEFDLFKKTIAEYWWKGIFKGMNVIETDAVNGSLVTTQEEIHNDMREQILGWNAAFEAVRKKGVRVKNPA